MADDCQEKSLVPKSGWSMLTMLLLGLTIAIVGFILAASLKLIVLLVLALLIGVASFIGLFGCMAIQPNNARVLLLFGEYAVVAARTKIVDGAVGMVQMALDRLSKDKIVELDDERRAAMVSNLLVVLCSDRHTQPVINTGSLYS